MFRKIFIPLLILPLIVAACDGESAGLEAAPASEPAAVTTVLPTETPPSDKAAEAAPTEAKTTDAESAAAAFTSECTLVSSMPEVPESYTQLFGVTENDWVYGPETAALTIVEYGDFQ